MFTFFHCGTIDFESIPIQFTCFSIQASIYSLIKELLLLE